MLRPSPSLPSVLATLALLGLSVALGLLGAAGSSAASSRTTADMPPETGQYAFKVGRWPLEVASMQPDGTVLEGTGTAHTYWIHDGQTLQDDLEVTFTDGSGFHGTTLRTYDPASGTWVVSYTQARSASVGVATARPVDGGMLETGRGEDGHGPFEARLRLFDIEPDHYSVVMDQLYEAGGVRVEGVWRYEATRIDRAPEPGSRRAGDGSRGRMNCSD